MVSNDNCHYGGHSRGSGKVLREREAEGDTVLVLSDFLLVSVRPLQSPRWLPMGVPQFTVSLPTSPVKGCATRLACLLLHRQRPPPASGVLIPAVNTRVTHSAGYRTGTEQGGHGWCLLSLPPSPKPGLGDAAWDTGAILAGRLWAISASLSSEKVLLRKGMWPRQAPC